MEGVVVPSAGPLKGWFSNAKQHKVAWAPLVKFGETVVCLGHHQLELV